MSESLRVLFAVPHFADPGRPAAGDGRLHGSVADGAGPRGQALAACVRGVHDLFHPGQGYIDHERKNAHVVARPQTYRADVVVCTTGGKHLLDRVPLGPGEYEHRATAAEPALLGYECHAVLRDRLGAYDYYCYLEDDIVLHDPWLLRKLAWFTRQAGEGCVLQPNRYEAGAGGPVRKVYVDGSMAARVTDGLRPAYPHPRIEAEVLGVRVAFTRPSNPHSGCFFLSAAQMEEWSRRPYFLDRQTCFIGPLESAASLGLMRTFRLYKPALENADFLEVEHFGQNYLRMIRKE